MLDLKAAQELSQSTISSLRQFLFFVVNPKPGKKINRNLEKEDFSQTTTTPEVLYEPTDQDLTVNLDTECQIKKKFNGIRKKFYIGNN